MAYRGDLVDEIITVEESAIKNATALIWGRMKLCIEPSAGVGVACVYRRSGEGTPPSGTRRSGLLCGGNLYLATPSLFARLAGVYLRVSVLRARKS